MTQQDLEQIQSLVNGAHRVLIFTHANPSVDVMASALALCLALLKMGKDATVLMETPPLVEVSNLVGIDQVKNSLSGKNLLITYQPYTLGDFEHVTYMEDPNGPKDSFKLTITPRGGFVPNPSNFSFNFTGSAADLIFTVEILQPTDVGGLYDANLFSSVPIINIDNHDPNKDYGKFNLVEPEAASLSEIVTFFLRAINAQMDVDIVKNLYQGITSASQNFQSPKVAAATLEAAAICLRVGAKQPVKPFDSAQSKPFDTQGKQPGVPSGQPQSVPVTPTAPAAAPSNVPFEQTQGKPFEQAPGEPLDQTAGKPAGNQVPADWTQPKAFRGTSVI